MRLALLGVRGSTPAPGAEFVRYGGHTSCVAVLRDGEDTPALVLDAGTGLRELGGLLGGEAFSGSILLSHLHWDHVHGLPFSPTVDHPAAAVDLYLPTADRGVAPADVLARAMSPPHFPIGPDGLNGSWRFLRSRTGCHIIEGYAVTFAEITHRGGLTYGIRVEGDGVAIATSRTMRQPGVRSRQGVRRRPRRWPTASTCCCTTGNTSSPSGPPPAPTATPRSTTRSTSRSGAARGGWS